MARKGKNKKQPTPLNMKHRWRHGEYKKLLTYLKYKQEINPNHRLTDEDLYDFRYCLLPVDIISLNLSDSDFSFASFHYKSILLSNFSNCKMQQINFSKATIQKTKLNYIKGKLSNFKFSNLVEVDFSNSDLSGADFSNSSFDDVNFEGANLSFAHFEKIKNIKSIKGLPKTVLNATIDSDNLNSLPQKIKKLFEKEGKIIKSYNFVISFAGENRDIAKQIAKELNSRNFKVFQDDFDEIKADLIGKNLYDYLYSIYKEKAEYCIIIISKEYEKKLWTNHERKSAQARAFEEKEEYIWPLKLDDTEIIGIPKTIGYIDLRKITLTELIKLLVLKYKNSAHNNGYK